MSNAISEAPRDFAGEFVTATAERMNARRNMRLGLWAGAKLGMTEEARAAYSLEVMVAGMIDPGYDDVVDKIIGDFTAQGVPMTRGDILAQLSRDYRFVMTHRAATH
jgi:hypothetical protein